MKANFEDPEERLTVGNDSDRQGCELPLVFRDEVTSEDCEHVRRIVSSSGFFSPDEILVAVELVQEYLAKGHRSGYHFLLAEHEGRPVGYACFGPIACTRASYDLYWIAVANEWRGSRIGGELLERSLVIMKGLGGFRVYVETSSRAQYGVTRLFYRDHGFEEEAVLRDFYDQGDHKVIFSRAIG